jgi:hypothetical protein
MALNVIIKPVVLNYTHQSILYSITALIIKQINFRYIHKYIIVHFNIKHVIVTEDTVCLFVTNRPDGPLPSVKFRLLKLKQFTE